MAKVNFIKDSNLSSELDDKGYIKVPFFNENELKSLREFYSENYSKNDLSGTFFGIHMTTWSSDPMFKNKIKEGLRLCFKDACDRFFKNHRTINHVFITKESGSQTEFNIHQDWSIVDEKVNASVNVWAPLYDVDEQSGALWIAEGSHKIHSKIRGAGTLFPDYRSNENEYKKETKCIPVKAGEALIFFHATIHGSPPNVSGNKRIVAVNSIVPHEAPLRIFFQKSVNSLIEVYEPEDDFVYNYNNIREESNVIPPKGKLISVISSNEYNHTIYHNESNSNSTIET